MKFTQPDPKVLDESFDQALDTPMFGFNGQTYVLACIRSALSGGIYGYRLYRSVEQTWYLATNVDTLHDNLHTIWALSRVYFSCQDYQDTPFWQFLNTHLGGQ